VDDHLVALAACAAGRFACERGLGERGQCLGARRSARFRGTALVGPGMLLEPVASGFERVVAGAERVRAWVSDRARYRWPRMTRLKAQLKRATRSLSRTRSLLATAEEEAVDLVRLFAFSVRE
jgi:hypothetical protein